MSLLRKFITILLHFKGIKVVDSDSAITSWKVTNRSGSAIFKTAHNRIAQNEAMRIPAKRFFV